VSPDTKPSCLDGAVRCSSPVELERCDGGEQWLTERCEQGLGCVEGHCLSLEVDGEAISPESLWRLPTEAWLNVWSATRGLPDRQILPDGADPKRALSGKAALPVRALCAPDGYVRPFDGLRRDAGAPHVIATALLGSGLARDAVLSTGVSGRVRLWLNGKRVLDQKTTPGHTKGDALRDERATAVHLRAGLNTITWVASIDGGRAPGLWLRVRAADGGRLPGLRVREGDEGARCGAAEVLRAVPQVTPSEGDFSFSLRPAFLGATPLARTLPIAIWMERADEPDQPLWKGTWRSDMDADESTEVRFPVRPQLDGEHRVALRIGSDPKAAAITLKRLVARRALQLRVAALQSAEKKLGSSVSPGSRESFDHHVTRLERALVDGERYPEWLRRQVKDGEALADAFVDGRDGYADRTGIVYRAYRSRLDGQLQPYVVFIPPSYRPDGKPMPMALIAHGLDQQPEHALRALIGRAKTPEMGLEWSAKHLPPFPDLGMILVATHGYQNAGPRGIGEHDLLRVVEEMQRDYRIDERRISLTGYSLGGTVAFVAPLHHPDVFSASAPLCGYPNLTTYRSIRGAAHQPWEDVMIGRRAIAHYAENGRHLPLHIVHGGRDAPARSKVVADRYRNLGYAHRFDIQDELGHNVWDYAYEEGRMLAWLRSRKRPDAPKRVRLRTGEHRYRRAHWISLFAMRGSAEGAFADIDATYDDDGGEVSIQTQNTSVFGVRIEALRPKPSGALTVNIDASTIEVPIGVAMAYFERGADGWQKMAGAPKLSGQKRADVAGPLDDALRHPLVIVYGTQRESERDANRIVAEHFSSYDTYAGAHYPVRADAELSDQDVAATSLVLIGSPSSNRVTASLIAKLPVSFSEDAITLRDARFAGRDVGVSLIFPHPQNDAEYVVVHAGVSAAGTLASRHLPRLAPDFLVYDHRITSARGGMLLDRREVLAGGFFDEHWK